MIQRQEYLDNLIRFKDKQLIKVVTGIRRCGKSTLFELYKEYLLNNGIEKSQIISINLEDADYMDIGDYKQLYTLIKEKLNDEKMNYIFLDEIQRIDSFQKVVDVFT